MSERKPSGPEVNKLQLEDFLTEKGKAKLTSDKSSAAYDEVVERLYDLTRAELRQLAWEALLISDGPDHIEGDVSDAKIGVRRHLNGVFKVFERAGWPR